MSKQALWRTFTKEQIQALVNESISFAQLAEKMGYNKFGGGTQTAIKQAIKEYNIDTSHFLGQGWNKNNYNYDLFTINSPKKNGKSIALPLIALRGRKCECCGLETWLDQPINLEVHHINGDRTNNSLENLQLLCPNCHSYTETFCYKSSKIEVSEEDFVNALKVSPNIHKALELIKLTPSGGNYTRARELIEKYHIEHLYTPNKRALRQETSDVNVC